eukprot:855117-Pleurochrysis_carterae.AAC.3
MALLIEREGLTTPSFSLKRRPNLNNSIASSWRLSRMGCRCCNMLQPSLRAASAGGMLTIRVSAENTLHATSSKLIPETLSHLSSGCLSAAEYLLVLTEPRSVF